VADEGAGAHVLNAVRPPTHTEPVRRHPLVLVLGGGAIGAVVVLLSIALDDDRSLADFVYDAGVGVLIATALGAFAAHVIQRYERSQEQARERVEREYAARLLKTEAQIENAVDRVGETLNQTAASANAAALILKLEAVSARLRGVEDALKDVQKDVKAVHQRVDRRDENPDVQANRDIAELKRSLEKTDDPKESPPT
jgi:primase-polymerase (primpol)-like protein